MSNSIFCGTSNPSLVLVCLPPFHFKMRMEDFDDDANIIGQLLAIKQGLVGL